ncbi:hypothetical protein F2Q70_00030180 [Brassica cretica]|uniref:CCHC-type domain-containing protein n=1 Tax=Brassica cretica TaxID=69181 RepID=A0A8S9FJL2_BRACR|nr:hypothetical protein F2Q70_00030180 [Brassica cretica]
MPRTVQGCYSPGLRRNQKKGSSVLSTISMLRWNDSGWPNYTCYLPTSPMKSKDKGKNYWERTGLGRRVNFMTLTGLFLARHVALPDHGVGLDGQSCSCLIVDWPVGLSSPTLGCCTGVVGWISGVMEDFDVLPSPTLADLFAPQDFDQIIIISDDDTESDDDVLEIPSVAPPSPITIWSTGTTGETPSYDPAEDHGPSPPTPDVGMLSWSPPLEAFELPISPMSQGLPDPTYIPMTDEHEMFTGAEDGYVDPHGYPYHTTTYLGGSDLYPRCFVCGEMGHLTAVCPRYVELLEIPYLPCARPAGGSMEWGRCPNCAMDENLKVKRVQGQKPKTQRERGKEDSETGPWYGLDNGQRQGFISSVFEEGEFEKRSRVMMIFIERIRCAVDRYRREASTIEDYDRSMYILYHRSMSRREMRDLVPADFKPKASPNYKITPDEFLT